MARAERRPRLDQPRASTRTLRPAYDPEAFGRLSESIARFLGTGRFLVLQSVFIALWVIWNVAAPKAARFDPYTFTFLTLVLSLQAAYAAPLILLAQNRQDDRDRANLAQDRDTNARIVADNEYISREVAALRVALSEVVTRDYLRAELRSFVEDFDEQDRGQRDRKRKAARPRAERDKGTGAERDKVSRAERDRATGAERDAATRAERDAATRAERDAATRAERDAATGVERDGAGSPTHALTPVSKDHELL